MQKCVGATICGLVIGSAAACWFATIIVGHGLKLLVDKNSEASWIPRFVFTLAGYISVFMPFYLLIHFSRKHNLHTLSGFQWKLLRLILTGNTSSDPNQEQLHDKNQNDEILDSTQKANKSLRDQARSLFICCAGLQVSYLVWGVLQEKIMTSNYEDDGITERFKDSQFLVFVNRILAFAFSGLYLLTTEQRLHRTPLYKYSYCSVSNTLSSWCQYEALKFISFPTQVLAKSAKVIPVMLMGKLISKTQYKNYEYVTAVLISLGMTAFLLDSGDEGSKKGSSTTTLSGAVLLCGYLIFDSFTANWQSALFKEHKPSSIQMMCGVNLMSCLFTAATLLQQGGFFYSLAFAARHPVFIFDCLMTAICSATGQLFIFMTVSKFGPVIFTIVMTVRQGLSILLSCIVYHHSISVMGVFGVFIVFGAIFLRTYYGHRDRRRKLLVAALATAPSDSISKV